MTLHEFSDDVIPMVQSFISLIGIVGLFLVWYQIKMTNAWNKVNTQHSLLGDLPTEEQERRFAEIYRKYKQSDDAISIQAAEEIYKILDEDTCIKYVLNKFEQLCAAINANTIDENYAYAVHAAKITAKFTLFENYVNYMRKINKDDEIYLELEKVATRWGARYKLEEMKRNNELLQLKAKRGATKTIP